MIETAFFVTGMGRSGTKWLAQLLAEDEQLQVLHEPISDKNVYEKMYNGTIDAGEYLQKRKRRMEKLSDGRPWGEVNSYLRYCVPELREVFGAPVIGLVRDGRATVRSLLQRGVYGKSNKPHIAPEWMVGWSNLDAYAKACWYWADTYRWLLAEGIEIFALEQLNEDYGYFLKLCERTGIEVDQFRWAQHAGFPINIGAKSTLMYPTAQQRAHFEMLAGHMQRRLGYE